MSRTRLNPQVEKTTLSRLDGKLTAYRVGNIVQVYLNNYQPGTITQRTTVDTLPNGWRPAANAYFLNNNNAWKNTGFVASDGRVVIEPAVSGNSIWASVSYPAYN